MKDIPDEIQKTKGHWGQMKRMWKIIHYGLGIVGILCSVSAASVFIKIIDTTDGISAILSLGSAICFGLMAFLLPSNNALAYERALSILEKEILKYKNGQNYALKFVIEAKAVGESIIANKNLIGEVKRDS